MKTCNVCGSVKPLEAFHRHKKMRDGRTSACKDCACERSRKWAAEYPELNRARAREWALQNSERYSERCRKHHQLNREARNAAMKARRLADPVRVKQEVLRSREKNPCRKLETDKAWQAANRDKVLVYRRVCQARRRAAEGSFTAEDLEVIRRAQRGRCAICSDRLTKTAHADHIKPIARGGTGYRNNIQLLCAPCNLRKHARDPIEYMQSLGRLL